MKRLLFAQWVFCLPYMMAAAFLAVVLFPLPAYARNNAGNIWYFGEVGLLFSGDVPTLLTDHGALISQGSAVISDSNGQLLFYTDGLKVWNKAHTQMPNGSTLMGSPFVAQPAVIVPKPGNQNIYYIFTVSEHVGLCYSTVDMTLNQGFGDVTEKNIKLWASSTGKITAVAHQNAIDIWVIAPGRSDNSFHAYLVTSSGVDPTPVISNTGTVHSESDLDRSGYLKASSDGEKLALSVFFPGFIELFDFDPVRGSVSNPKILGEYDSAYGIAFSPDSSKLYATTVSWVDHNVYQFDLEAVNIASSATVIGKASEEMRFQALQVAPDGRIYLVLENSPYLGVIHNPNQPGTASEYVENGIYLEGKTCNNSFPTFVQSLVTPPQVTLTIHDVTADEHTLALRFPVTLSDYSRSDVLVDYAAHDGTATAGYDYLETSGTLKIPRGSLEGTISVPILDDEVFDEGHETVIVELSKPVRAVLDVYRGSGTIQENDLAQISIKDAIAGEGNRRILFPVNLSAASRYEVSVEYSTENGTATAGSEYTAARGTLTIPAGERSGTIAIDLVDDTLDEPERTFIVKLSNPVNAKLVDEQAAGTITDDDPPPLVSCKDVGIHEQTGTMTFAVNLSTVSMFDVMAGYSTRDASATAGRDYAATSGNIFIPAGMLFATVKVDISDDTLDEDDEIFFVELSNPVKAAIADNQAQGVIYDNDAIPAITIHNVTSPEDAGMMLFPVRLSAVSGRDVSVNYETRDRIALADQDYNARSGRFTIPAGSDSGLIGVKVLDDAVDERDETFSVRLSEPLHATLAGNQAEGTIHDNDPPPVISINDAAVKEDAGSMIFEVTLSHATYQDVTLSCHSLDGTAVIADNDYLLLPHMLMTIPAGATRADIMVAIHEDSLAEGDETVFMVLHDSINATLADDRGTGTIIDNDALPVVSIDNTTIAEEAGSMTFTVSLSEVSALPVILHYRTRDQSASGGSDYVPVEGMLAIAPESLSGEIVVPLYDDTTVEGEETFMLELSDLRNAAFANTQGAGTIVDNDVAPAAN